MANDFSKEEIVAFEDICEGFNDNLVLSSVIDKYEFGMVTAERAEDTIWRPMPFIARTFDGLDQSSNFDDITQLSVPTEIGFHKSAPFKMTATDLRDGIQRNRYITAAKKKLGSDVNVDALNLAAREGTIFVKRSGAATGYDDVAEIDAAMNELGIPMEDRFAFFGSRAYNLMAGNLAARETINEIPTQAFRKSYVGEVANIETFKMDYGYSLTAKAGTTVTVNGANQRHVPKGVDATQAGKKNYDNRTQTLAITVGSGTVKVGDAFTMPLVNSVHHLTKADTGQLKTFRIVEILSGSGGTGNVKISPAIISADSSPTAAELQYKNCTAAPANGVAITFLNTVTGGANPFFHKEAIELVPAELGLEENAGMPHLKATTDQGLQICMTRQGSINDLSVKYRLDVKYGLVMKQPEMAGIIMFSQT